MNDNMNKDEKIAHGTMWFLMWVGLGICLALAGCGGPLISITMK